jgi:hypothetical protein
MEHKVRYRRRWFWLISVALIGCSSGYSIMEHPAAPHPTTQARAVPSARSLAVPVPEGSAYPTPVASSSAASRAKKPPSEPKGPRIGSIRHITWIYQEPKRDGRKIGYIREGTSVALKTGKRDAAGGCPGGWYELNPNGFVCNNSTTTLNLSDPVYAALHTAQPNQTGLIPYRFALSSGAPMYTRIPTLKEQVKKEGPVERRPKKPQKLGKWASGHEELAEFKTIKASDSIPDLLKDHQQTAAHGKGSRLVRKWIPNGSMLAYSHAFQAEGRTWLLLPDMTLVPADRVRPFRTSKFHGISLGKTWKLPLGWTRHNPATKYKKTADGLEKSKESWGVRTPIMLTGQELKIGNKVYLETKEKDVWVLAKEVSKVEKRTKYPAVLKSKQKWLDVSILSGTLVAYVGEEPTFVTLVSPGVGGVGAYNASNEDLVKYSTTPRGIYRINWKTRAAAMSPEKGEPTKFWIADVPFTQYFRPPFALHVAYWHEDFGMPKSAGCINLSPEDGKFLFGWTDPTVPEGWQGAGPNKWGGSGTMIVVRR